MLMGDREHIVPFIFQAVIWNNIYRATTIKPEKHVIFQETTIKPQHVIFRETTIKPRKHVVWQETTIKPRKHVVCQETKMKPQKCWLGGGSPKASTSASICAGYK